VFDAKAFGIAVRSEHLVETDHAALVCGRLSAVSIGAQGGDLVTETPTGEDRTDGKGKRKTRQFSWIESWSKVVDENTGQTRGMTLTLSDWLYEGILMEGGVLAIHPDYFRLTGGRNRWLYRVARTHAGGNGGGGFTISVPTLFEKSGAEGSYRCFKFELKKIAEEDRMPEYHLRWEDDIQGREPAHLHFDSDVRDEHWESRLPYERVVEIEELRGPSRRRGPG
jgi:hypothetical protein